MNISSHATTTLSPHLIDAREAARLCGVSVATWYRMEAAGRTPRPVRPSPGTVRWRHADLTDWIDAGCPPRDEWDAARTRHG